MKLPNNKTSSLVVFVALIVTIIISYNEYQKRTPQNETLSIEQSQPKATILIENKYESGDADADGLSDWEEMLWKTDPKKKDTDGDGTNDGEEVALSRDPLKKGPNDKYSEITSLADGYTPMFKTDPNSLTSQVAKTILTKSFAGGGSEAAIEIAQQIKEELEISKIYKKDSLVVFSSNETTKMERYASELIEIQLDEYNLAINEKDNIYKYSDAYKRMGMRMSVIEVPYNLVGLHIDYINNFNALSIMARRVADAEKDPIVLLATIPEYLKLSEAQKLIIEQIKLYYENNDIIFIKSNA